MKRHSRRRKYHVGIREIDLKDPRAGWHQIVALEKYCDMKGDAETLFDDYRQYEGKKLGYLRRAYMEEA